MEDVYKRQTWNFATLLDTRDELHILSSKVGSHIQATEKIEKISSDAVDKRVSNIEESVQIILQNQFKIMLRLNITPDKNPQTNQRG